MTKTFGIFGYIYALVAAYFATATLALVWRKKARREDVIKTGRAVTPHNDPSEAVEDVDDFERRAMSAWQDESPSYR